LSTSAADLEVLNCSRKPEEAYKMIEALFQGPYCELFACNTRLGLDCWGDEVGKFGGAA